MKWERGIQDETEKRRETKQVDGIDERMDNFDSIESFDPFPKNIE